MPHGDNAAMSEALTDTDIERLQGLLDALPAPLQPLDVVALDGYLTGVLLQPTRIPEVDWWPGVVDVDGQPVPAGLDTRELATLVRRRHDEIDRAIKNRDWFDPWVFALDDSDAEPQPQTPQTPPAPPADASAPSEALLPWVAGFASAQDRFAGLTALDDKALLEPLALLYLHVDPADLEDADDLLPLIEEIEPPADLAEAVQDLVRAVMLIADVSRPRAKIAPAKPRPKPGSRRKR